MSKSPTCGYRLVGYPGSKVQPPVSEMTLLKEAVEKQAKEIAELKEKVSIIEAHLVLD